MLINQCCCFFQGSFPITDRPLFFLALLLKLVVFFVTAPVFNGVADLGSDYVRKISGDGGWVAVLVSM